MLNFTAPFYRLPVGLFENHQSLLIKSDINHHMLFAAVYMAGIIIIIIQVIAGRLNIIPAVAIYRGANRLVLLCIRLKVAIPRKKLMAPVPNQISTVPTLSILSKVPVTSNMEEKKLTVPNTITVIAEVSGSSEVSMSRLSIFGSFSLISFTAPFYRLAVTS